jgi:hypothetical protein
MADTNHLVALQSRLSREKARLAAARSPKEIQTRTVWVAQAEREVAAELRFLGLPDAPVNIDEILDDDIFAELSK